MQSKFLMTALALLAAAGLFGWLVRGVQPSNTISTVGRFLTGVVQRKTDQRDAHSKIEPARVEPIPGTDLKRVTLTARAAERLGIQTAPVRGAHVARSESGTQRTVIPYSAVIYDVHGGTWTYTNPDPLVFVRHRISVDSIDGDLAALSDGPPAGAAVVTTGAAELFGAEFGVGK